MVFKIGPEIVLSYKRLSYTPAYALAEFVDNSTQAYSLHQEQLDAVYETEGNILTVSIEWASSFVKITDNSIGMSSAELGKAITLGKPPEDIKGRSRYGLGLKTAAFWFGDKVTITTKKLGEQTESTITLLVDEIAKGNEDVHLKTRESYPAAHYTIILIEGLHRQLTKQIKDKVKDFLTTFYKVDLESTHPSLKLLFNEYELTWNEEEQVNKKLRRRRDGSLVKKTLELHVGGHTVTGWAGVLQKGSRALAGFSLIQANRVVETSFKTPLLFGRQAGGSNTLVNQRLLGELRVDGFDISHTKDKIHFSGDEYNQLDLELAKALQDFVDIALKAPDDTESEGSDRDKFSDIAIHALDGELGSPEFIDAYNYDIDLPEDIIERSKRAYVQQIMQAFSPRRAFRVGSVTVLLYLVSDQSVNDPYLSVESVSAKELIIIVNQAHPHWEQLESVNAVLNFLRHCIYDGLAEWKCINQYGRINADSAKLFKDKFLRVPFEMDINSRPAPQREQPEAADANA